MHTRSMAVVRVLVDGYSLLHSWPELAPGEPRYSAAAREQLVHMLTCYQDATGTPVTVVFDGARARHIQHETSPGGVEVVYSKAGQTADQVIERVTHRLRSFGEALVITDDFAERDTVIAMGGVAASCSSFIQMIAAALGDLQRDLSGYNSREKRRYKGS